MVYFAFSKIYVFYTQNAFTLTTQFELVKFQVLELHLANGYRTGQYKHPVKRQKLQIRFKNMSTENILNVKTHIG